MAQQPGKLQRTMSDRHIVMLALGGAIGAGLFKGSSSAIELAGPAVIVAYALGGLIMLFVMQGLAELAVRNRDARNFRDLVKPLLGDFAGYFVGWNYWTLWALAMAAEAVVAASFLQYWFDAPLWALALIVTVCIIGLNLLPVKVFAETEYWFASIKILVIALFIIFGLAVLLFPIIDGQAVGFNNLTAHGGFFAKGIGGVVTAMMVVVFSYGGSEMIGMTLAEAKDPDKAIPRAVRSTFYRIVTFYVVPFLIIVSLIPWNEVGNAKESPFVTVFEAIGIPYVPGIMNFVMLTAVLSAMNTGLYASSRMLYTQAADGKLWSGFTKLSKYNVPVRAVFACTAAVFVFIVIAIFKEQTVFNYLLQAISYTILFTWLFIVLAHLKSRKGLTKLEGYHVKLFPATSIVALLSILAIFVSVIMTASIEGNIASGLIFAIIAFSYLFVRNK